MSYDQKELVRDMLAVSKISLKLEDKPLSTGERFEKPGLIPSDVSGHMTVSPGHGMVTTPANCLLLLGLGLDSGMG